MCPPRVAALDGTRAAYCALTVINHVNFHKRPEFPILSMTLATRRQKAATHTLQPFKKTASPNFDSRKRSNTRGRSPLYGSTARREGAALPRSRRIARNSTEIKSIKPFAAVADRANASDEAAKGSDRGGDPAPHAVQGERESEAVRALVLQEGARLQQVSARDAGRMYRAHA